MRHCAPIQWSLVFSSLANQTQPTPAGSGLQDYSLQYYTLAGGFGWSRSQTPFFVHAIKMDPVNCLFHFSSSAGTLFFSNLTFDVIEDCIPHYVPTTYYQNGH